MIRKRTTLTTNEKKQRLFLFLFGLILLGVGGSVIGLLLDWQKITESWTSLAGDFFQVEPTLLSLLVESLSGAALFLLGFFLLGFSAIGQPLTLLLLCTYGFCMGSVLINTGTNDGNLMRLICLLPYDVPVSMLMVVAARESLRFSGRFTAFGFQDDPADQMMHQSRLYCVRFVVLMILLFLLAMLYSLAFYAFRTAGSTAETELYKKGFDCLWVCLAEIMNVPALV